MLSRMAGAIVGQPVRTVATGGGEILTCSFLTHFFLPSKRRHCGGCGWDTVTRTQPSMPGLTRRAVASSPSFRGGSRFRPGAVFSHFLRNTQKPRDISTAGLTKYGQNQPFLCHTENETGLYRKFSRHQYLLYDNETPYQLATFEPFHVTRYSW